LNKATHNPKPHIITPFRVFSLPPTKSHYPVTLVLLAIAVAYKHSQSRESPIDRVAVMHTAQSTSTHSHLQKVARLSQKLGWRVSGVGQTCSGKQGRLWDLELRPFASRPGSLPRHGFSSLYIIITLSATSLGSRSFL